MRSIEKYCQIKGDICKINLNDEDTVFTAYSSRDAKHLAQIRSSIKKLNELSSIKWLSWESDLNIENNMIFCEICQKISTSKAIMVELSDLNFNVVFEYGYSISLNKKIFPTVNESFDYKDIERYLNPLLGIGIGKYKNNRLAEKVLKKRFWEKANATTILKFEHNDILSDDFKIECNNLFYIKNIDDINISDRIDKELSNSNLDVITDNSREDNNKISWYIKQIKKSYAVIIDLGRSNYSENYSHFLKCALVAGMAIGTGRRVLLINSSESLKPSDIISIIDEYSSPKKAQKLVNSFLNLISNNISIINSYLDTLNTKTRTSFNEIDLGEHVAENDFKFLNNTFIETTEYSQIKKLGYKLIVGRKGTGKSAIFQKLREEKSNSERLNIFQMFDKYNLNDLYDLIITFETENNMNKIAQAFWKYILLLIIAKEILKYIEQKNPYDRTDIEDKFKKFCNRINLINDNMTVTEKIVNIFSNLKSKGISDIKSIQDEFYSLNIVELRKNVITYLIDSKVRLQLNFDGLDKNISIKTNNQIISLILFNLHDVCSSIFTQKFQNYSINLFIRKDLYDSFKDQITEKDKIKIIYLKWHRETLLRLINSRLQENEIENIVDTLDDSFTIRELVAKINKYVYLRPRDYIFIFNNFFENARCLNRDKIDSRTFNESLQYYANHLIDSLKAEFIALTYEVDFDDFMSHLRNINNNKEKIPISNLQAIISSLMKPDHLNSFFSYLLDSEVISLMENNEVVKWNTLRNPTSKLKILLSDSTRRNYCVFHPIIHRIIDLYF